MATMRISPGKSPTSVADALVKEFGTAMALKTVARERARARRARSRKRFAYWIAISEEIAARGDAPLDVNSPRE